MPPPPGPRRGKPGSPRPQQQNQGTGRGGPRRAPAPRAGSNKPAPEEAHLERLQKILAHAGIASRRACEELIEQGRVSVDGKVVRELGTKVDPRRSKITLDDQPIRIEPLAYFAVYKPRGYVSTNNDPGGRPRVIDLLPEIPQRVYSVGRLDEASTGLILLTNDGELANRLAHPRYGVEKLYRALVAGHPSREVLDKLIEGVWLAEGKARARKARITGRHGDATVLELVLAEGKNREVRRMLAKLGHKVMSLTRVAVGPIRLRGLKPGQFRPLSRQEVQQLRQVTGLEPGPKPRPSSSARPSSPGRPTYQSQEGPPRPRRSSSSGGPPPTGRPTSRPATGGTGGRSQSGPGRPPSSGAGRPQAGPGRPPASAGRPQSGSDRPQTGTGRPPSSGAGRPQAGAGRPPAGAGRPQSGSGRPQTGAGRPPTGAGRPANRPPAALPRPPRRSQASPDSQALPEPKIIGLPRTNRPPGRPPRRGAPSGGPGTGSPPPPRGRKAPILKRPRRIRPTDEGTEKPED